MYEQGGAAKQFALDNFTEAELTKKALPATWEQAVEDKEGWYVDTSSRVLVTSSAYCIPLNKNIWPTRELAEACLALSQLAVLRDAYREGWVPNWICGDTKYCLSSVDGKVKKERWCNRQHFLSFPTVELCDNFLSNFESLIIQAKPLL